MKNIPELKLLKKIASDCVVYFDVPEYVYICNLINVVTDLYNHEKNFCNPSCLLQ